MCKVNQEPYPVFDTPKTLSECGEDYKILGIRQSVININLPAIMTIRTSEETIPFLCNGKKYLFVKKAVEKIDSYMQYTASMNIVATAILLNAPRLFDSREEKAILEKCVHPDYDWEDKHAFLSAFNTVTEEGKEYFQAFVEFLAARYSTSDHSKGMLRGMIVSNEIDSQYIWGNAGEKTVQEYMKEYEQTMRLAYQSARKYYSNMRIYISLDHFFSISMEPEHPKRFYKGKEVLTLLNQYARENGNFDWSVAYHPYPECLSYPDFYNDRTASFDYSTLRITLKNIEMLPAFLSQKEFLFEGKERHIILSEQGFHSAGTDFSEKQGAAAYCLAYQKVKKIPTIDMFMHHAYVDNPYEFGLNLGIRQRNNDGTVGKPKRIYNVMKDMGTDRENIRIEEARQFIGEELFDSLLNPDILYGENLLANNMQFQKEE